MEISWLDLFFVVVNFIMLVLIYAAFFLILILLVRLLWRRGGKKTAKANSDEKAVGLGEALRRRRQGCGMTQELVAEQLGVSRQAVSRWEKGEARPSTANIQALAELYGIAPAELLQEAKK